jgi:uncharacterized 2Fe-2S/4Fe-4S cluster protein (DUF4445 family)
MAEPPQRIRIEFEPVGRRAEFDHGITLLRAAQRSGVELASTCGGDGTCGCCRVRVVRGEVSAVNATERGELTEGEIAAGMRLACQTRPAGDVLIDIPPESLTAEQRLQLEGDDGAPELDPPVVTREVALVAPSLDDLRSDAARLRDTFAPPAAAIPLAVLRELPRTLRRCEWRARVAVNRSAPAEVVAVLPPDREAIGLAVDLGTTKLAAYLVDLGTGATLARGGAMNPQIAYGEDVLSRITYAGRESGGRRTLQAIVAEQIELLARELCAQTGHRPEAIVDCVVVGNTAMHHLFAGLPVRQLGAAPYVAAESAALDVRAAGIGLPFSAGARCYSPPVIAGYVGGDHVAMLLASGVTRGSRRALALDIGTNTEISVVSGGQLWSCSTASGPAFEGAHISAGMRAAPGAIERVRFHDGAFEVQTVGGRPPVGLCGSGMLDAIAASLDAGIIDRRGALVRSHPLVDGENGTGDCLLVPARDTGSGADIRFTRADVGEIQLARGAIRAGTALLLEAAGLEPDDLSEVIVAGAFGTYLDLRSAVRVGLLPAIALERFRQVGNAAGAGARRLLLSRAARAEAAAIAARAQYLELTTHPAFAERFAEAMRF